jgi:hypothetical protein
MAKFQSTLYKHKDKIETYMLNINAEVKEQVLGPCFVAEGPAGRNTFGKTCLYVTPKLSLIKLRYFSVSEGEGSNRLKDGVTF